MQMIFDNWLKSNNKPSRYCRTILTISNDLYKVNYSSYNLYNIQDSNLLNDIMNYYLTIPEYNQKNKRGNNMYSSAFKAYIEFILSIEDFNLIFDSKINTEYKNLIICRLGQGTFRRKLINYWKHCPVTGITNIDLLVASHIKPWNVSNDAERLDVFNGILLSPNIDKLFDKGYVSFNNEGNILISSKLKEFLTFGINKFIKISLDLNHCKYLEYHRDNIFKDNLY